MRQGRYANSFAVGHNAFEFILDFGQKYDDAEGHVHTRIVTGPSYARALYETLGMSLQQYEREFGAVKLPKDDDRDG